MIAATSQSTHSGAGDRQTIAIDASIDPMAISFILNGIAPFLRQAMSGGPYTGWMSSQASIFGEERAKQATARIIQIVPGSTGRI